MSWAEKPASFVIASVRPRSNTAPRPSARAENSRVNRFVSVSRMRVEMQPPIAGWKPLPGRSTSRNWLAVTVRRNRLIMSFPSLSYSGRTPRPVGPLSNLGQAYASRARTGSNRGPSTAITCRTRFLPNAMYDTHANRTRSVFASAGALSDYAASLAFSTEWGPGG